MKRWMLNLLSILVTLLLTNACDKQEDKIVLTEEGKEWVAALKDACDDGKANACMDLGLTSLVQEDSDRKKEREYFTKACDGGIGKACAILAMMWNDGVGGEKDPSKSNQLIQRACDLGDSESCSGGSQ